MNQNVSLLIYRGEKLHWKTDSQVLASTFSFPWICHMGIHIIIRRLLSEFVGRTSGIICLECVMESDFT